MSRWASLWLLRSLLVFGCAWRASLSLAQAASDKPPAEFVSAAVPNGAALARELTWQRLLHIELGTHRSEINSPEFFLSPQGRTDALQELQATVAAHAEPWPTDTNLHPRCRFPARYAWLASQGVALPGYRAREPRCARLERWARFDHLHSVSLILVSGYFGNPASTFGHAMLKFNTDDGVDSAGLLDVSVNFGALVPENEMTALYVFRGLTGRYQAAFSDKEHYTNDMVYGRTEFRDMWDHELQLTDAQRSLLVLHVAELAGKKFDYYFLTKNCGLRLAELVELATGRRVVTSARGWYAPVEVFHALTAMDAQGPRILASQPRFVPSAERVLNHEFQRLNPQQAAVANGLIADGLAGLTTALQPLPPERQLDVLDVLLAYQQYRLTSEGSKVSDATRRAKDRVLLERLRLPPRQNTVPPVPSLPSPAEGHSPMLTSLGWTHDTSHGERLRLQWVPFSYELGGFHGLPHGELAVMDTVASVGSHGAAQLEQLDVIRVRKLSTRSVAIEGESQLSWQLRLGMRRRHAVDDPSPAGQRQTQASFGVGRAAQWSGVTGFAMLEGHVQSGPRPAAWGPQLGLIGGEGDWKWIALLARRQDFGAGADGQNQGQVQLTRRVTRDQSVRLGWERDGASRLVVAFQQYW